MPMGRPRSQAPRVLGLWSATRPATTCSRGVRERDSARAERVAPPRSAELLRARVKRRATLLYKSHGVICSRIVFSRAYWPERGVWSPRRHLSNRERARACQVAAGQRRAQAARPCAQSCEGERSAAPWQKISRRVRAPAFAGVTTGSGGTRNALGSTSGALQRPPPALWNS